MLAALWLLLLCLAAGWAQFGITDQHLRLDVAQLSQPPSAQHWLGTDPYGRDVLADLALGTRRLFITSLPAALLATVVGMLLGAAAGYWGNTGLRLRRGAMVALLVGLGGLLASPPAAAGWWLLAAAACATAMYSSNAFAATVALPVDGIVLGTAALLSAVPRLLLALALAALHAPAASWLVGVLVLTCWPNTARLTRTLVQQLRLRLYVEAGRAAGFSTRRLLWSHIAPNAWPTLRPTLPLNLSICLGLQTTLAFLGIGLAPDQADWGLTLATARLEPGAWWLIVSTLIAITTTIVAIYQLLPNTSKQSGQLPASSFDDVTIGQ